MPMNRCHYKISIAGENSLIVYFDDKVSHEASAVVAETAHNLNRKIGHFIIDLIPSYVSLLVIYDPLKTDHHQIKANLVP